MDQAFRYCEHRVRETDKDRFLATLFADKRHRGPLFALYAFDAEIAQVRDRITSSLPGEVRLQWWRDVLNGPGRGEAAANPVAAGLLQAVDRFALPMSALVDVIDAHSFDLYDEPMATLAALENYAAATSATMMSLAAGVLNDGSEPGHGELFRHAGIAVAMTALLARLPFHAARGQRYLPDDVMARHGAEAADVHAGRASKELAAALAELREVVAAHLAALKADEGGFPARLLPAVLPVSLVPATLARMAHGADPFRPRLMPQWRRQWILWRAARHPERFISVARGDPAGSGDRQ
jgi:phytoene synthase